VHLLDPLVIFLGDADRLRGTLDEESVVCIAGWVALRLKEGIEIPETAQRRIIWLK